MKRFRPGCVAFARSRKDFRDREPLPEGKMRTQMHFAGAVMFLLIVLLPAFVAYAQDEDRASVGEWIALAIIVAGVVSVIIIAPVLWRRDTNRHTGLPSKIKRRRGRGPLNKVK
jgi:membrane protein YdbS with pleckstrin-like domain